MKTGEEGCKFAFDCAEVSESMDDGICVRLEPSEMKTAFHRMDNAMRFTRCPEDHGFEVGKLYILNVQVVKR